MAKTSPKTKPSASKPVTPAGARKALAVDDAIMQQMVVGPQKRQLTAAELKVARRGGILG